MTTEHPSQLDEAFVRNAIGSFLRIGVLLLLIVYCLRFVGPFVNITLWATIIAVSLYPLHQKFAGVLGGRKKLSATVIVLVLLAALLVPVSMMTNSTVEQAQRLSGELSAGEFSIPAPSEKVKTWPVIGRKAHEIWSGAAENLQATASQFKPQLVGAGEWLLKAVGGAAGSILAFVASIIIAGFFLVSAQASYEGMSRFMTKLAGESGTYLTDLCVQTIRSVTKGVLGVAIIQTLLAAVGLVLMDVPATGILLAIILLISVMQVPTLVVIVPIIIWVYSIADGGPATIFAIYMILVSLSDNFLKPVLLGRGVEVPTLVILLGAIGGAISAGLVGLFLGAVVLALGYELLMAWMKPEVTEEPAVLEAAAE
jgi:predicted PurR-regulated permease PerM